MLQSAVSFLGNKSTVWNSQYLKKILRIPEDQLKILNNIPGWGSEVNSSQSNPSIKTVASKDCPQASSVVQTAADSFTPKDLIIHTKEIEKNFEDINRKEDFPLRKSSSLDSVSIHNTNLSYQTLKRSSSASNIKERSAADQDSAFCASNSNHKNKTEKPTLSIIEEVEEMPVDTKRHSFEKSQFSNSGVQCHMSQDLNCELDIQKVAVPALPPCNPLEKRESLKLFNPFSPLSQTYEREKMVEKSNLSENNNCLNDADVLYIKSLKEKSKIDVMNVDESYISLSVPCAQPPSENIQPEKEPDQKEVVTDLQNTLDKATPQALGKRKRKSKVEKSKKHRGVNVDHIKIEYSAEQIKNMIELLKVFHKF